MVELSRRYRVVTVVCLIVVVGMGAGIANSVAVQESGSNHPATTVAFSSEASAGQASLTSGEVDADFVRMAANLDETGDTTWEVRYQQRLDTDDEVQAFEELRDDIEADPDAYLEPFEERMERLVESAAAATDREMAIEYVTIETNRETQPLTEFGIVTYRFEWQGFATVEEESIRAGDAIDSLFIDDDEQLQFGWPAGYALESVTPEPTRTEETRVTWDGRLDFETGEPRVVVRTDPSVTDEDDRDDDPMDGDERSDEPDDSTAVGDGIGSPMLLGALALAVIAALAAVGFFRLRSTETTVGELVTGERTGEQNREEKEAVGSGGETGEGGPSPDLLSNEERVLALVEEHGGRVKQQRVTEELGWSAARTSQIVGDLRDAGTLESFRLGRENVLTLPEVGIEEDASEVLGDESPETETKNDSPE